MQIGGLWIWPLPVGQRHRSKFRNSFTTTCWFWQSSTTYLSITSKVSIYRAWWWLWAVIYESWTCKLSHFTKLIKLNAKEIYAVESENMVTQIDLGSCSSVLQRILSGVNSCGSQQQRSATEKRKKYQIIGAAEFWALLSVGLLVKRNNHREHRA